MSEKFDKFLDKNQQDALISFSLRNHQEPTELKFKEYTESFPQFMSNMFSTIERQNYIVTHIFVNARLYALFRVLGQEFFTPYTAIQLLRRGIFGHAFGATVIVNSSCPQDEMILVGEKGDRSLGIDGRVSEITTRSKIKILTVVDVE